MHGLGGFRHLQAPVFRDMDGVFLTAKQNQACSASSCPACRRSHGRSSRSPTLNLGPEAHGILA